MITYLIQSTVCSALFFGYYMLVLRNRRMHRFNRFYLLFTVVMSIIIPLLHINLPISRVTVVNNYQVLTISTVDNTPDTVSAGTKSYNGLHLAFYIYAVSSLFFLAMWGKALLRIIVTKSRHGVARKEGYTLIYMNSTSAPYSFFSWLFWNDSIDINTPAGQKILTHELTHIRQFHALDKQFLQLVVALFWVNPIYWLIQKELAMVHEFLADEAAIADRDTDAFARMLLHATPVKTFPDITHRFFHSPIKRRLLMLQNTTGTRMKFMRAIAVTPLLAGTLVLFSFRTTNDDAKVAAKSFIIALDAGHGGEDGGAKGWNETLEKDINRKIADRLAELGPTHNIRIVNVRPDDRNVVLEDRAAKANDFGADLLLSIHMGSEPKQNGRVISVPASDETVEFIISGKNSEFVESRKLASAIASSLNTVKLNSRLTERNVAILRSARMPAVAMACGSMDKQEDIQRINNPEQLDAFCHRILDGIVRYKDKQ